MLIIGSGDLILRLKMNVTSAPKTLYRADDGVNITGQLTGIYGPAYGLAYVGLRIGLRVGLRVIPWVAAPV